MVGALVLVAWFGRFVQDDAFISFRYAEHFARGHGFVWNVGEAPIQGFTNPLWTLLIALGIKVGFEPVGVSYTLGLTAFAGTIWATYRLARALGGSHRHALLVVGVVGLNASVCRYATGGLETSLQTFFFTAAALCGAQRRFAVMSVVLGLAIWTRLDSGVITVGLMLPLMLREPKKIPVLAGIAGVMTIAMLVWTRTYFGQFLPNTFYLKAQHTAWGIGLEYLLAFVRAYGLVVPLLFLRPPAAIGLWVLYVASVGGDFMEFRFLVPIFPMLVAYCARSLKLRVAAVGAAAMVVQSALYVFATSDKLYEYEGTGIETIYSLERNLTDPTMDWVGIGRSLNEHFGDVPDTTLAVGAAGAMPFYSKLRTIDIFGLNDAWVARNGATFSKRPGHTRRAPFDYLVSQRTSFFVLVTEAKSWRTHMSRAEAFAFYPVGELPAGASIVELPLGGGRIATLLYLVKNPAIDARIARDQLRVLPLD